MKSCLPRCLPCLAAAALLAACDETPPGEVETGALRYASECIYFADVVDATQPNLKAAPLRIQVAAQGLPGNVRCPDLPPGWRRERAGPVPPPEHPQAAQLRAALQRGGTIAVRVVRRGR